jgi:threonyl-tRNA synthetase
LIEDFWREEHLRGGYDIVYSPHIGKSTLWETSGHLDFYSENMYSPMDIDGQDYYVKPMNCPFHIQMYKNSLRSYRELPIRLAELGTVYRYERSGVLHGLLRVRGFTQDDAHIFCRPDQVKEEIERCVEFMRFFLGAFGFEKFHVYLATRDASGKYAGSLEDWGMATNVLRDVINEQALPHDIDEGGAVFYGPKIDVKMVDTLGREWQCTTIQFDFNLPERFDVTYIAEDGRERRPYMVHRALLGSMERFFGVLLEHYAGAFPLWLAPVQAIVIPIADRHIDYAQKVAGELRSADLRVEIDARSERMQAKIRDAQLQKVPYMLVVGDREAESNAAAVRLRSGEDLKARPVEEIIARMKEGVSQRV